MVFKKTEKNLTWINILNFIIIRTARNISQNRSNRRRIALLEIKQESTGLIHDNIHGNKKGLLQDLHQKVLMTYNLTVIFILSSFLQKCPFSVMKRTLLMPVDDLSIRKFESRPGKSSAGLILYKINCSRFSTMTSAARGSYNKTRLICLRYSVGSVDVVSQYTSKASFAAFTFERWVRKVT